MAATFGQYAYLAGLIDGDGCIMFRKAKSSKTLSGFTFQPTLLIVAKDRMFLQRLMDIFGGHFDKQGKSGFNGKQIWSLRFSPKEMREHLPHLIPHFILKRVEGELLLEALTITEKHRYRGYDPSKLEGIADRIKLLKSGREATLNYN